MDGASSHEMRAAAAGGGAIFKRVTRKPARMAYACASSANPNMPVMEGARVIRDSRARSRRGDSANPCATDEAVPARGNVGAEFFQSVWRSRRSASQRADFEAEREEARAAGGGSGGMLPSGAEAT